MKGYQKKIIIFSTIDSIISIPLVHHVVSQKKYKKFKFDIIFMKSNFIRKIKVLIVIILFGSIIQLIKKIFSGKTIKDLIKFKNVEIIKRYDNKHYDYGLSIYYTKKLKLQKYKIYNFHLGSLYNQRGSFIFFHKFIHKWSSIDLTFHEIQKKFDMGYIINKKKIKNLKKINAFETMILYLNNLNFLDKSIDKIENKIRKSKPKRAKKLYTIPTIKEIFSCYLKQL
tara:strand:+ start:66 stop:743 length:678 start_codon:yes stop_codon:yes gene_type:complete